MHLFYEAYPNLSKIMINMLRFVAQDQCFMKYAGQCETYATCPASWWGFAVTPDPEDCCDCRLECYNMIKENNKEATNQWGQIQMKSQRLCLIDLNRKNPSTSVYICSLIPLFSSTWPYQHLLSALHQLSFCSIKILSGADSGSTFHVDDVPQEGLFWSGNHTKVPLVFGQVGWFGRGLQYIWKMEGERERPFANERKDSRAFNFTLELGS